MSCARRNSKREDAFRLDVAESHPSTLFIVSIRRKISVIGDVALAVVAVIALTTAGPGLWARLRSSDTRLEVRDVQDFKGMLALTGDSTSSPGVVQIVMFTDHECAACFDAYQQLVELSHTFGSRVVVSTAYFPLPQHKNAVRAANASVCAKTLTPTTEIETALYVLRNRWTDSSVTEIAALMPPERRPAFISCAARSDTHPVVARSRLIARQEAFAGTPSIVVDGGLVIGGVTGPALANLVLRATTTSPVR